MAVFGTGERLQLAGGPLVRLPFWRGEGLGRTTFLGLQVGRFLREVEGWIKGWNKQSHDPAVGELASYLRKRLPLSENAAVALADHLVRQYERAGALPSDRCVLIEQFQDVNGDPLIVIHSPFGSPVNQAWRLALADALAERWGIEAEILATDDGLLLRLPDRLPDRLADRLPGCLPGWPPELGSVRQSEDPAAPRSSAQVSSRFLQQLVHLVGADEVERRIWRSLQGSALLGSAFRAAAGRALLLSRGRAGRRLPLWLQRLQAQDLWEATRHFADFPILVEATREVFQDYLDVAALRAVLHGIRCGRIRVVPVVTRYPTPFTASLLFNYAGAFIYETDEPRAAALARTAAATALPPPQSPQLQRLPREIGWVQGTLALAGGDLRSLLDQDVLTELLDEMRATAPERTRPAVAGAAGTPAAAGADPGLVGVGAGSPRDLINEDGNAGDYDAAVLAYALSHGPFTIDELVQALGTAGGEVENEIRAAVAKLVDAGEMATGIFRITDDVPANDHAATEYCHIDFLRVWERRSLSRRRQSVVGVQFNRYLHFLLRRHLPAANQALAATLLPLLGLSFSWDTWCCRLLPVRVPGSLPTSRSLAPVDWRRMWEAGLLADLAELGRTGRLVWQVYGGPSDPVVALLPQPGSPQPADPGLSVRSAEGARPAGAASQPAMVADVLRILRSSGALFLHQLQNAVQVVQGKKPAGGREVRRALAWLFLHGAVTSDSPRPLALLPQLAALAKEGESPEPQLETGTDSDHEEPHFDASQGLDGLPVWGRRGSSPRARRAYREARQRARAAVSGPTASGRAAPLDSDLEKSLNDGRWWVPGSTTLSLERWLDQALALFGIVTPTVWSAWRGLLAESGVAAHPVSGSQEAEPAALGSQGLPHWPEVYQELRRREWQGGVLRGRFVEELDDPQFMRTEDAGALAAAPDESGGDERCGLEAGGLEAGSAAELVLLSANDPINPYGLLCDWPGTGAVGRDPCTWLLFRLHEGKATLLLTYAPRAGVVRVLGEAWRSLPDHLQVVWQ